MFSTPSIVASCGTSLLLYLLFHIYYWPSTNLSTRKSCITGIISCVLPPFKLWTAKHCLPFSNAYHCLQPMFNNNFCSWIQLKRPSIAYKFIATKSFFCPNLFVSIEYSLQRVQEYCFGSITIIQGKWRITFFNILTNTIIRKISSKIYFSFELYPQIASFIWCRT